MQAAVQISARYRGNPTSWNDGVLPVGALRCARRSAGRGRRRSRDLAQRAAPSTASARPARGDGADRVETPLERERDQLRLGPLGRRKPVAGGQRGDGTPATSGHQTTAPRIERRRRRRRRRRCRPSWRSRASRAPRAAPAPTSSPIGSTVDVTPFASRRSRSAPPALAIAARAPATMPVRGAQTPARARCDAARACRRPARTTPSAGGRLGRQQLDVAGGGDAAIERAHARRRRQHLGQRPPHVRLGDAELGADRRPAGRAQSPRRSRPDSSIARAITRSAVPRSSSPVMPGWYAARATSQPPEAERLVGVARVGRELLVERAAPAPAASTAAGRG